MEDLKREYVVPLRKKVNCAPRWRRAKKAVNVLQQFVEKHMKCENIIVCAELNHHLWGRGGKNPPGKVEVVCLKKTINNSSKVFVNLKKVGVEEQLAVSKIENLPKIKEKKKEKTTETKKEVVETQVKEVSKKTQEKVEDKKEENEK
jgi:large subunit ribosomal protein L31e